MLLFYGQGIHSFVICVFASSVIEHLPSFQHGIKPSEGTEQLVQTMDMCIQDNALKCGGNKNRSQENYV